MDRIQQNQERIDFLKEWIEDLKKTDTFESKDKVFQLESELRSRQYFMKVYLEHKEKMAQQPQAQLEAAKKNYQAAIKMLKEVDLEEKQHKDLKKDILKRSGVKKKITEKQLMEDYQNAMALVNYSKQHA